jgi:tRNA(His) 5'-end guanylyltransferase
VSLNLAISSCITNGLLQGHINNLYNTAFWALIQIGGMDAKSAEKELAVGDNFPKWN